jgi:protein required for attachment to host cells
MTAPCNDQDRLKSILAIPGPSRPDSAGKNLNGVIASKLIGELDKKLTNHPVNQFENLVLE